MFSITAQIVCKYSHVLFQSWVSSHDTKVLYRDGNNDYWDFYNSFDGEGFSLLLNLAQGGVMPGIK